MAAKENVGVKVRIRTTEINIRERICASYSGRLFDVNTRREDAQSKHGDPAGAGSLFTPTRLNFSSTYFRCLYFSYCSLSRVPYVLFLQFSHSWSCGLTQVTNVNTLLPFPKSS